LEQNLLSDQRGIEISGEISIVIVDAFRFMGDVGNVNIEDLTLRGGVGLA
jgi:hypothetical protein